MSVCFLLKTILAVRELLAGWSTADQPELGYRRKSMLDSDTLADLAICGYNVWVGGCE